MWRALIAALLAIGIGAVVVRAQTNAPLPSSTSETQATLGYGQIVLQLDNPTGFMVGQLVQITSQTDQQYAIGTITAFDPILFNATINITTPNTQGNVYFSFLVQVLSSANNQVGIHADLTAVSTSPYNGVVTGTTNSTTPSKLKMTVSLPGSLVGGGSNSTNIVAPTLTAGNTYAFQIAAGQYYPTQGAVQIDDLTPSSRNHYTGNVFAYNGTELDVTILSTFSTGSPSSTWGIYGVAGPQSRIQPYGISGLQVSQVTTSATLNIAAGCVRDSGDQVDLCVNSATTIDLSNSANIVSAQGSGTVTNFGGGTTSLVGSGTTFTSTFSSSGKLADLTNQTTALGLPTITARTLIWDGVGVLTNTSIVTNDTHATLGQAVSGTNGNYFRGGPISPTGCSNLECNFGIILARKDSSGVVSPFGVSFTPSGAIDLPAGYTYYRVIAVVGIYFAGGATYTLRSVRAPLQPNIMGQLVSGVVGATIGQPNPGSYVLGLTALPNPTLTHYDALPSGFFANSILTNVAGTTSFLALGYGLAIGAGNTTVVSVLSQATNTLGSDVNLTNTGTYFDGPSMAQGLTGTWFASGTVTLSDSSQAGTFQCKLWDATTVIASGQTDARLAGESVTMSLSGYLASPAANIRISCKDSRTTSGAIQFNASGNSKDSSIWGIRIQ